MIKLPENSGIEVNMLERMVTDSLTTSYKLFWFQGVFEEILLQREEFSFRRIVCRMIADSWYPLLEYHLNFGVMDKLYNLVMLIQRKYEIESSVREDDILEFLENLEDPEIESCISDLYKMVPYRLIAPFFSAELVGLPDHKKNSIIAQASQLSESVFYSIDISRKTIKLNSSWSRYLRENQVIVKGWLNFKLIYFLQSRNPNVPAIPNKLSAPVKRDLSKARKLWTSMENLATICDIYTGNELSEENCREYGSLSIDHFIPWSFVMHDELWNLTPTFARINSSKNNKLPKLDLYIDRFCDIQYETYSFIKKNSGFRKYLEDYINLSATVDFSKDMDKKKFSNSIKSAVTPLFQIAYNQGYGIWTR